MWALGHQIQWFPFKPRRSDKSDGLETPYPKILLTHHPPQLGPMLEKKHCMPGCKALQTKTNWFPSMGNSQSDYSSKLQQYRVSLLLSSHDNYPILHHAQLLQRRSAPHRNPLTNGCSSLPTTRKIISRWTVDHHVFKTDSQTKGMETLCLTPRRQMLLMSLFLQ